MLTFPVKLKDRQGLSRQAPSSKVTGPRVCRSSAACPANHFCSNWKRLGWRWQGSCVPKLANGQKCTLNASCASGECKLNWVRQRRCNFRNRCRYAWVKTGSTCYKPKAGTCEREAHCTNPKQFCDKQKGQASGKCVAKLAAGKDCPWRGAYKCASGWCKRGAWKRVQRCNRWKRCWMANVRPKICA